jgi:hypothetical protein
MSLRGEKRGLSTIVATLLIILLTLVAVGIVWVVVRNVIIANSEQISLGKLTLDLKMEGIQISGNDVGITVKRNAGKGEFVGLNFIVEDGVNSEIFTENVSMNELEVRTFNFTLTKINPKDITKIELVPIFRLKSGKEIAGDVKDTWKIGSGVSQCTPNCFGKVCGSNGCLGSCGSCGTGQTCNLGICVDENTCTDTCLSLNYQCGTVCGIDCGTCTNTHGTTSCSTGICQPVCDTNYRSCDGNAANGCETQLGTTTDCGSCGDTCNTGYTCVGGVCVTTQTENWQTGLISWWKLDGNALDSIGTNNGIVNGATPTSTGCRSGQCYSFDGVDDYIITGASESLNIDNKNFTISVWYYVPTDAQVNWNGVLIGEDYSTGYELSAGRFFSGVGTPLYIDFSSSIPRDIWYNVIATHNSETNNGTIYINGVYISSDTYAGDLPASDHILRIAGLWHTYFNGSIDEVMIWNRTLNADEVSSLYNSFSCPETNTAFCTRLNKECGSVTALDNCGTSRTVSSCGTCTSPKTCQTNGTCIQNLCTDTCASLGYNCGSVCGVSCGSYGGGCQTGYYCSSGTCVACTTHASSNCTNGDVYWWNSCGQSEGIKQDCNSTQTCSGGSCVNNPPAGSQIIADHTIVDRYDDIPQCYIDQVKKMYFVVAGESHSLGYMSGLVTLESLNGTYDINYVATPEAYTDTHLRISRTTWGDLDNAAGWLTSYGEEDWFTSPTAISRTKAGITYCHDNSLEMSAFGFGWCYDGGILDATDYLSATQAYVDYCTTNGYNTKVFFTTGPVDDWNARATEGAYDKYLMYQSIRDYVAANSTRILFDYADILCYDYGSETPNTQTWNGHTFPVITTTNNLPDGVGHISEIGTIRIAKAVWWMMARIAGWDGVSTTCP